jgi:glycosyltransferase involved in cell wall biosynthesis
MGEKVFSKVSVIITTYKRSMVVLRRAVDSALNQSYPVTEVIVVNDDPLNRETIDAELGGLDKVRVIHNEENRGACFSRNRGAEASSVDLIAFLDDDDEWENDKIEKQVRSFDDETVFVYCTGHGISGNGSSEKLRFIKQCSEEPLRDLIRTNCIGGCSFPLINKKAFFACGGFDPGFLASQDHDLWLRLAFLGKIVYVDEPLVRYSFSSDSITNNMDKRIQGYRLMLKKHSALFRRFPKSAADYLSYVIWLSFANGKKAAGLRFAVYSFFLFPYNIIIAWNLTKGFFTGLNVKKKNAS